MSCPQVLAKTENASSGIGRSISRRSSTMRALIVLTFFSVGVGGTAAWLGFPPTALAWACNQNYYTKATNITGMNYADYGVRASTGDQVFGGGVECVHVDSVIVKSSNLAGDFAEVGWHTQATGYNDCHTPSGSNHPQVMYAWRGYGSYSCYPDDNITISTPNYYPVSVRADVGNNLPNSWIFDFDGTVIIERDLGFSQGTGYTNAERHYLSSTDHSNEDSNAHYKGMQYRQANPNPSWAAWTLAFCWTPPPSSENDPYYNNQLLSNTEVKVSVKQSQCSAP